MKSNTLETALRNQIKEEIGEDELKHPQKSMVNQKYGLWDAHVTDEEIKFWEGTCKTRT